MSNRNEYMKSYMSKYRKTPKGKAVEKAAHKKQTVKEKIIRNLPKLKKVVEKYIDNHLED